MGLQAESGTPETGEDTQTNENNNLFNNYSHRVKRLNIPVHNFKFCHDISEDYANDMFIGRDDIRARLKDWIINNSKTGAYLVTGYRGMGKTSFVEKVIKDVCGKTKKGIKTFLRPRSTVYIPVKINLSHEVLEDRDVLCLVVRSLKDAMTRYSTKLNSRCIIKYILTTILAYLAIRFIYNSINHTYFIYSSHNFLNKYSDYLNLVFYNLRVDLSCLFYLILFIITYAPIYFLINKLYLFYCKLFGVSSIADINKDFSTLNERIDSSVSEENGINSPTNNNIFGALFGRKNKQTQTATVREIEQELINILNKISNYKFTKIQLIIVFDELDKIDPVSNYENSQLKNNLPEFDPGTSGFSGGATSRSRKQNIFKILSNMKYFLSTAKAKFIFISGRELYDAFLADVSDREFAISSIFNGVIYVNSFLTSSKSHNDITNMTARYICKRLFDTPKKNKLFLNDHSFKNYWTLLKDENKKKINQTDYTLKRYHKYLTDEKEMKRNEADYTVCFLYHFSFYLAHISNGSPKKIAIFFEKCIRSREYLINVKKIDDKDLEPGVDFFLSFGFYSQYKINFVHYIAYPIIQAMINKSNIYGDKLLVSTSFMINHIYKYHNNGFSWRNLEHIPELLEVNKTPELRDFIGSIIGFLKQTHLHSIMSGLYLFKFPMRISEEISFHSKLSEEISALFNFSLDESLSVKLHYAKLLEHYTAQSNDGKNKKSPALASIHHILADIYMGDEDFSQAIFEYQNCLQFLADRPTSMEYDKDPHWPSHMLTVIRTMLKLGLTFEKRKTFNSAYFTYSELIDRLVYYRYLNEENLGLCYQIQNTDNWNKYKAILFEPKKGSQKKGFEKNTLSPTYDPNNKKYCIESDKLRSQLANWLTPVKSSILSRLSLFEDIRLVYQASLAKLFVLEKIELGGITKTNLAITESEFINLHISTNISEKFIISADFFRKLGDIMYYKNGLVSETRNNLFHSLHFWGYDINEYIERFCIEGSSKKKDNQMNYLQTKKMLSNFVKGIPFVKEAESEAKKEIWNNDIKKENNIFYKEYLEAKIEEYITGKTPKDETENQNMPAELIRDTLKKFINGLKINIHPKKIEQCRKHRDKLLISGKRLPCYACKFYNRSLKILIDELILSGKLTENECDATGKSKTLTILKALLISNKPLNLLQIRENYLVLFASTLEGLGNVLISCSDNETKISDEFLDTFFKIAEKYTVNKEHKDDLETAFNKLNGILLSSIEKAILYFWCSTRFFNYSNNLTMAFRTNKRILEVLTSYVEVNDLPEDKKTSDDIDKKKRISQLSRFLDNVKDTIVERALINIYSHYEYINIVEIKNIEDMLNIPSDETNSTLHYLSLFPDIEEILYAYYSLEIACRKNNNILNILKSSFFSRKRFVGTLTQNILNLKLKAEINKVALNTLLNINQDDYTLINKTLDDYQKEIKEKIEKYASIKENDTANQDTTEDSKSKAEPAIVQYADKNKDNISNQKAENKENLKEELEAFYFSKIENHNSNTSKRLQLIDFLCKDSIYCLNKILEQITPLSNTTLFTHSFIGDIYVLLFEWNLIADLICKTTDNSLPENQKQASEKSAENLKDVENCIQPNAMDSKNKYQIEMAIKKYTKTKEMHSEGKAYKEMIENLFLLDDDLNNDTCQFQFALERYRINVEEINIKLSALKKLIKGMGTYNLDSYLK